MLSRRRTNPALIVALLLLTFAFVYPFYYILILTMNDPVDALKGGIYFWPREFTTANYVEVFRNPKLLNSFLITLLRVAAALVFIPFLNALYGYAISHRGLVFRKFFTAFPLITMYVGGGVIPFYLVLNMLHLVDSFWVYIIPALYVPFYLLIFRQYYSEFALELREAAIIDGCNEFRMFMSVMLPLSLPVFATVALFTAVAHWNDWFVAQAYIMNPDLWPLQTILLQIVRNQDLSFANLTVVDVTNIASNRITPESIKLTMVIVATLPIALVYPFLQKYFIKGAMIGAVKE